MRVSEMDMYSPSTVEECLYFLHEEEKSSRLLAGGTDAVVRMKDGYFRPEIWINLSDWISYILFRSRKSDY